MQLAEATSLSCFINDVEETEEARTFGTGDRGGARKLVLHKIWGPRSENCENGPYPENEMQTKFAMT